LKPETQKRRKKIDKREKIRVVGEEGNEGRERGKERIVTRDR
jgi:hypothetical protein